MISRIAEETSLPEHQVSGVIAEALQALGKSLEAVAEMRAA
jgi:hypothetical protein